MGIEELELQEKWQSDQSFVNWALNRVTSDVAKWDAYLKDNPQHVELAELTRFGIQNLKVSANTTGSDKSNSEIALSKFKEKISEIEKHQSKPTKVRRLPSALQIAASIALVVGLGYWVFTMMDTSNEMMIHQTYAEITDIQLTDGTNIILNKNSMLSYLKNDVRNVRLEGEAYFNVSKSKSDQDIFTVTTDDLKIRVLGTQFNVQSVEERTKVYLDEGKVSLELDGPQEQTITMSPGELVSYSKKDNQILENGKAESLANTAWKETTLFFENASLREVLSAIQHVHGLDLEAKTSVNLDEAFTGGIPVRDIDITLKTLNTVYGLDVQIIDSKLLVQ